MIIEEQIAQVHGMSLVLRHEVSEDNIIEEYNKYLDEHKLGSLCPLRLC